MTLWSGRFTGTNSTNPPGRSTRLCRSINAWQLQDVRGSIAWAAALQKVNVLTHEGMRANRRWLACDRKGICGKQFHLRRKR